MLDPNTDFFQRVTRIIENGDFTGPNRPVGRVTFIDAFNNRYHSDRKPGLFRSNLFGQGEWIGPNGETRGGGTAEEATELQVNSIAINRGLDQDAATCSITMYNVRPGAYAPQGDDTDPFGFGYLSATRGVRGNAPETSVFDGAKTNYHYDRNGLSKLIRPNYMVRTYQGYGSDNFDENGEHRAPSDPEYVHPANDTKLVLTGVWLIDKVTRTANPGQVPVITVECRDLAKLLITQIMYPRLIPLKRFPLIYGPKNLTEEGTSVGKDDAGGGIWIARLGHESGKALDGRPETWWQNFPENSPSDYTGFDLVCDGARVRKISITLKDAPVDVYVEVQENGSWVGSGSNLAPDGTPYVLKRPSLPPGESHTLTLPRTYEADMVRLIFTNLGTVDGLSYCAGIKSLNVFNVAETTFEGDYSIIEDWSEAVKELCAWAGFTWWDSPKMDPLVGKDADTGKNMAVWGDFEYLGAGPIQLTPGDYFVAKSFMEGIRQIADFLGAIFYVDHTGGAQFRMPNVWAGGNFIVDPDSPAKKFWRRVHPIEFHEDINLYSFSITEDDAIMRHEILVVGAFTENAAKPVLGGISLIAPDMPVSFRGLLNGQKRLLQIPGEATKLFKTEEECQRMAELTAVKLLYAYRKASSTIQGHPGLHIDDQVRIFERTSGEAFVHYVNGIDSNMDIERGEYTMTVNTNWLGSDPDTDWFVETQQITRSILDLPAIRKAMGKAPQGKMT